MKALVHQASVDSSGKWGRYKNCGIKGGRHVHRWAILVAILKKYIRYILIHWKLPRRGFCLKDMIYLELVCHGGNM
jgi:hypothetical protein